ncbi:hypothetical protein C8R46DRAFT_1042172 [Mycena filopes]|nr:hypothetical protein C8R46DRAFT_1042172 [Mycena filopes]
MTMVGRSFNADGVPHVTAVSPPWFCKSETCQWVDNIRFLTEVAVSSCAISRKTLMYVESTDLDRDGLDPAEEYHGLHAEPESPSLPAGEHTRNIHSGNPKRQPKTDEVMREGGHCVANNEVVTFRSLVHGPHYAGTRRSTHARYNIDFMAVRQSSVPGGSVFLFKQLPEVEDDSLYGLRQGLWDYTGLAFGEIDAVLLLPDLTVFLRLKCPNNATCETTRLFRQQEALLRAIILDDNSQEYLATSSRLPPVDGCFYVRTDFTWRTMTSFLVGVHIMMRVRLSRHDIDLRDRVKREYWLDIQAYKVHGLDYIPTRGVSDYRLQRHANHTLGYAQYDRDFLPTRDRTDSDNLSVYTFKRTVDDVEPSNSRRLGQRPFTAVVFGVVKEVVQLVRTLHQILALDAVDYMLMKSDSVDKASALAARLDRSINKILRGVVKFERVDDEAQTVLVKVRVPFSSVSFCLTVSGQAYTMICIRYTLDQRVEPARECSKITCDRRTHSSNCRYGETFVPIRVSTDGDWNVFSYKSATTEVEATLVRRGRIPEYRPTVFGRVSEIVAKEVSSHLGIVQGGEIVGSWVDREPSASPRITLHIPNHITDFLVDDIVNGDVLGVWVWLERREREGSHGRQRIHRLEVEGSERLRGNCFGWVSAWGFCMFAYYSASFPSGYTVNAIGSNVSMQSISFAVRRYVMLKIFAMGPLWLSCPITSNHCSSISWVANHGSCSTKLRLSYITCKYSLSLSQMNELRIHIFRAFLAFYTERKNPLATYEDWAWVARGDGLNAQKKRRSPAGSSTTTPVRFSVFGVVVDDETDHREDIIKLRCPDWADCGSVGRDLEVQFNSQLATLARVLERHDWVPDFPKDMISVKTRDKVKTGATVFLTALLTVLKEEEDGMVEAYVLDVVSINGAYSVFMNNIPPFYRGWEGSQSHPIDVDDGSSDTPVDFSLWEGRKAREESVRRLKGGARTCPSCERIIAGVPVRDNAFEMALAHAISNRGLLKSRRQVAAPERSYTTTPLFALGSWRCYGEIKYLILVPLLMAWNISDLVYKVDFTLGAEWTFKNGADQSFNRTYTFYDGPAIEVIVVSVVRQMVPTVHGGQIIVLGAPPEMQELFSAQEDALGDVVDKDRYDGVLGRVRSHSMRVLSALILCPDDSLLGSVEPTWRDLPGDFPRNSSGAPIFLSLCCVPVEHPALQEADRVTLHADLRPRVDGRPCLGHWGGLFDILRRCDAIGGEGTRSRCARCRILLPYSSPEGHQNGSSVVVFVFRYYARTLRWRLPLALSIHAVSLVSCPAPRSRLNKLLFGLLSMSSTSIAGSCGHDVCRIVRDHTGELASAYWSDSGHAGANPGLMFGYVLSEGKHDGVRYLEVSSPYMDNDCDRFLAGMFDNQHRALSRTQDPSFELVCDAMDIEFDAPFQLMEIDHMPRSTVSPSLHDSRFLGAWFVASLMPFLTTVAYLAELAEANASRKPQYPKYVRGLLFATAIPEPVIVNVPFNTVGRDGTAQLDYVRFIADPSKETVELDTLVASISWFAGGLSSVRYFTVTVIFLTQEVSKQHPANESLKAMDGGWLGNVLVLACDGAGNMFEDIENDPAIWDSVMR